MSDTRKIVDTDRHVMTRLYEVGMTFARVSNDLGKCLDALLEAAVELAGAERGTL